ncbi:MAG: glutamine--tRNA ligase/YqeY domain fusion protein, partial [Myxococcota bacterium]
MSEDKNHRHFIHDIIDRDLDEGRHRELVTRFPPEPNGYLHIGHAKAVCLNFGLAEEYRAAGIPARCHLRFDDTNPAHESEEFAEAIAEDIRWLGFDWGEHLHHASDYYERLYAYAEELIQKGLAYVESVSDEEVKRLRGSVTEPGTPSPFRDRSVEENLELFRRMKAGEFADGEHVLRAKIDLGAANMKMRDPAIYRIKQARHYRRGDDWCIYPLYDFAHCLSDATEGITHSLCSLEFENNRELYDWFLEHLDIGISSDQRPHQYEFARLNLTYTMMSKRKLRRLVDERHVTGWDDPRMPTLSGMRRRGVTADAIRAFATGVGVARNNSTVDVGRLEHAIRDDLNHRAPRRMAVLRPLVVELVDMAPDAIAHFEAPSFPDDVRAEGDTSVRRISLSKRLFIERGDFAENPPKGFFRLVPGGMVRLRYGPFIRCEEVLKEGGAVTGLRCRQVDPGETRVRGVIHWVAEKDAVPAVVRLYDRLFEAETPVDLDDL